MDSDIIPLRDRPSECQYRLHQILGKFLTYQSVDVLYRRMPVNANLEACNELNQKLGRLVASEFLVRLLSSLCIEVFQRRPAKHALHLFNRLIL
jgi:hypothetical protein